jgi:hypothetical protein
VLVCDVYNTVFCVMCLCVVSVFVLVHLCVRVGSYVCEGECVCAFECVYGCVQVCWHLCMCVIMFVCA